MEAICSLSLQCSILLGSKNTERKSNGSVPISKVMNPSDILQRHGRNCLEISHPGKSLLGGTSVAQIFIQRGEVFFRDYESEALRKLSQMLCKVIATGGGAVLRAVNWKYMKRGISVYLNVHLDALASRIGAVGNSSLPLLDDSGDAYTYTKAFVGLFPISKKRADTYARYHSFHFNYLATNLGGEDVLDVTPAAIATEVLLKIDKFLTNYSNVPFPGKG